MTDEKILTLMREAPSNGQRALFDKYYNYVFSIVSRIISGFGSPNDSEECVIDVFASIMMKMHPDDNISLRSYIGAVARNTAISMRRSVYYLIRIGEYINNFISGQHIIYKLFSIFCRHRTSPDESLYIVAADTAECINLFLFLDTFRNYIKPHNMTH